MELGAIVESFLGEEDEVVHGVRRDIGEEIDRDRSARGFEGRGEFLAGSICISGGLL